MPKSMSGLKDISSPHPTFRDRAEAAQILGGILKSTVKKIADDRSEILVLGIPRGGAIVADIVSDNLGADFDMIFSRKITSPYNKEYSIGAVMSDGTTYFDDFLVESLKIPPEYIKKEKEIQLEEIRMRKDLYRPNRTLDDYTIRDKVVILVDDGIATGATVIVAARWIRRQDPIHLIIAVPVAPPQTVDILKKECDTLEIVSTPVNFGSVGQFYKIFEQELEDQVVEVLKRRGLIGK
jgi:putative phosphoribosyl transferase